MAFTLINVKPINLKTCLWDANDDYVDIDKRTRLGLLERIPEKPGNKYSRRMWTQISGISAYQRIWFLL